MAIDDKNFHTNDDDETGSGGGQSGKIEFRDFIGTHAETRDDLLSHDEKKRLLLAHQDSHEAKVKLQKEKIERYKDLKNGKTTLQAFREGKSMESGYKTFPEFVGKAQFSGSVDNNVSSVPNDFNADTNADKRNELTYQPAPRFRLQQTFNPKPRGPGY